MSCLSPPTAVPFLAWPHLSAIACLAGKSVVPAGSDESPDTYLPHRLRDIPGDLAFATALQPNQATDTPGGLMSHICQIAALAGKDFLDCSALTPFPIRLRRNVPGGKAHLGPQGLVLPWPGLVNDTVEGRHDEIARQNPAYAIPAADTASEIGSHAMAHDLFWDAVDHAVDPKLGQRSKFEEAPDKRQWLVDFVTAKGGSVPASLTVHVCPTLPNVGTRIELRPGGLHLEIGFLPPPDGDPALWSAEEHEALLIERWPCGAFKGY